MRTNPSGLHVREATTNSFDRLLLFDKRLHGLHEDFVRGRVLSSFHFCRNEILDFFGKDSTRHRVCSLITRIAKLRKTPADTAIDVRLLALYSVAKLAKPCRLISGEPPLASSLFDGRSHCSDYFNPSIADMHLPNKSHQPV